MQRVANVAAVLADALARLLSVLLLASREWQPGTRQFGLRIQVLRTWGQGFNASSPPVVASATHESRPNKSLEATSTGIALGPRSARLYHALRGPSAMPVAAPQLQR